MIKIEKGKTYWMARLYCSSSLEICQYDTLVTKADIKGTEDEYCFGSAECWLGNGAYGNQDSRGEWFYDRDLKRINFGIFDEKNSICITETREQLIKALASSELNFKKLRTSVKSKMNRRIKNIERFKQEYFKLISDLSMFDEISKIVEKM